ncbi:AIPR protein [Lachnospiraceae bacterium G11]|nr:AIPR protein [Lachnospiraceae bacterium G11]
MGNYGKKNNKINEIEKLIKRTILNRDDDNDIDWDEDEIKKSIMKLVQAKDIGLLTGDELGIECEADYFFVTVNKPQTIKDPYLEVLNKIKTFYNNREKKDKNRIVVTFIVSNLEIRASLEIQKQTKKEEMTTKLKKESGIKRPLIEFVYIINQKAMSDEIEIQGIDRYLLIQEPRLINSLNIVSKKKKNCRTGYVVSVDLLKLIEIYNAVGDRLFDNNVRYGLDEQMGVNEAIRKTLETDGESFWYRNNGITLLIESDDFALQYPNKIVLKKTDNFSVINGAQTITVASNYYYEILARKNTSCDDAEKHELEQIIKSIKSARVLLRLICLSDKNDKTREGREISIALNRQKPIKIEDIAYTLDYVSLLEEIISKNDKELGNCKIRLIKRGEPNVTSNSMDLVEFARARLACGGDPLKARNASASALLKIRRDGDKFVFDNTEVFCPIENVQDYKKYYNAIRFAHDLSEEYMKKKKAVIDNYNGENGEKWASLISNAKWYFVSQVVEGLNGNNTDFTSFSREVEDYNVVKMMTNYFLQAIQNTKVEVGLSTFKNSTWWDEMRKTIKMDEVLECGENQRQESGEGVESAITG